MDFGSMVVALTGIGCGTAIVIVGIDKFFSVFGGKGKLKAREEELRLAQERLRERDLRIVELHRQNELLQKQLEWHNKLLETQDRSARLPAGETDAARARLGRVRGAGDPHHLLGPQLPYNRVDCVDFAGARPTAWGTMLGPVAS